MTVVAAACEAPPAGNPVPASTSRARPLGAMMPLTTKSSALPISRVPSCARKDWSTPAILQFSAHHAAEPSWRAISSTVRL
jgi:hypothetical protein